MIATLYQTQKNAVKCVVTVTAGLQLKTEDSGLETKIQITLKMLKDKKKKISFMYNETLIKQQWRILFLAILIWERFHHWGICSSL